jgi:hypothetical protein
VELHEWASVAVVSAMRSVKKYEAKWREASGLNGNPSDRCFVDSCPRVRQNTIIVCKTCEKDWDHWSSRDGADSSYIGFAQWAHEKDLWVQQVETIRRSTDGRKSMWYPL